MEPFAQSLYKKLSTTTSARRASARNASRPRASLRSSATERLLRLTIRKNALVAPGFEAGKVAQTARLMRELLLELGLQPFLMTTGSRGLHVVAPLDRGGPDGARVRTGFRLRQGEAEPEIAVEQPREILRLLRLGPAVEEGHARKDDIDQIHVHGGIAACGELLGGEDDIPNGTVGPAVGRRTGSPDESLAGHGPVEPLRGRIGLVQGRLEIGGALAGAKFSNSFSQGLLFVGQVKMHTMFLRVEWDPL